MSARLTTHLEPTLNELVGLPDEVYFPFGNSIPKDSKAPIQYDRNSMQRISMRDVETDDGRLKRQNGASIWLPLNHVIPSKTTRPLKFCNEGTQPWGYYEAGFTLKGLPMSSNSNTLVGVITPNNHEPCVDPWEVALDQEPPFYRKVFMEWVARQGTPFKRRSLRERFRQRLEVCPGVVQSSSIRHQSLYVQNFYTKSKSLKKDYVGTRKCYATHRTPIQGRLLETFLSLLFVSWSYVYSYHGRKYTLLRVLWDATSNIMLCK